MSWAMRRRATYLGGILLFLLIFIGVPLAFYLNDPPNCFDGKQNGEEQGIDCGGACQLLCPFQATDPTILWSRAFEVTPGIYNAVAYVENPNSKASVPEISYTFKLFDRDNLLIAERAGKTFLSPNRITPIFEPALITGNRLPVRTFFEFTEKFKWFRAEDRSSNLVIRDRILSNPETKPRVDATLLNTSVDEFTDIDVIAVIFGSDGNAIHASKTFVELLPRQALQNLVFTWPMPFEKRVEACSAPVDVMLLLDVSGSMNDDGGDPPQPIGNAIAAAGQFIERLDTQRDQVGVTTFATKGKLIRPLTSEHGGARNLVLGLAIDPIEERGFTNIGDAISLAHDELNSVRRNDEARKVMVLLTDGRANAPEDPGGEPYALTEAESARANEVVFYTIGLGEKVNKTFLNELAGAASRSYLAGTSLELGRIYREISASLCVRGPAVLDIIPKTKDAFSIPSLSL